MAYRVGPNELMPAPAAPAARIASRSPETSRGWKESSTFLKPSSWMVLTEVPNRSRSRSAIPGSIRIRTSWQSVRTSSSGTGQQVLKILALPVPLAPSGSDGVASRMRQSPGKS